MFGISGFELFIILLFGFLLFGPDKLPAIARTVGRGIAKFRAAQQDMSDVLKESNAFDPNSDEPFKDPTETIDKLATTAEKHLRSAGSSAKTAVKAKTHEGAEEASAASANVAVQEGEASVSAAAEASAAGAVAAAAVATLAPGALSSDGAKVSAAVSSVPDVKAESFTERKARYERERAARMAVQSADAQSAVQPDSAAVAETAVAQGGER